MTNAGTRLLTSLLLILIFSSQAFAVDKKLLLPPDTLTGKQIANLFAGMTVSANDVDKDEQLKVIYFDKDGGVVQAESGFLTKGKWQIREDDRLCINLKGKKRDCSIIVKAGKAYRQYAVKLDGNHKHELTYVSFKQGKQLAAMSKAPILPPGTLTRKEIVTLFSGKTVKSVTAKKKRTSLSYYAPDGTVEQVRDGKKRFGKWRVNKNGRICLQMENLKEKCRIIVNENGAYKKYIVKKNGKHQHSVSYRQFLPGKRF